MNEKVSVVKAVKTATFKLHNPSRRKRAMLDYALIHNHLAYSKALNATQPLIEELVREELEKREKEKSLPAKEKNDAKRQRKWERNDVLYKKINEIIKPLPLPVCAKQPRSIPGDIIGQVESHLELHDEQESVGLPTVQRLTGIQPRYEESLDKLSQSLTVEDENTARDEVARLAKAGKFRPLLFPVNHKTSGFLLLKDDTKNRYFIWLNLVPSSSRFAQLTSSEKQSVSSRSVKDLIDMRTGEVVSFRSKTGCLFPIEFAREYQDTDFLQNGSPLSAKLLKRDDDYEVHIAFEFVTPKVETKTLMGVDRGIYNLASVSVSDKDGTISHRQNIDGRDLRYVQKQMEKKQGNLQKRGKPFTGRHRLHAANEAVHRAANEIVRIAKENRSQVIMENLSPMTSRGKKRKRSNFNRVLNRSQYQKLQKVLKYKMAVAGLPQVKEVHPGYTSQACPICGHISSDNREKIPSGDGFKMDVFRCVTCGHKDDSDLNAARNIALKRMWRESLSPALRTKTFNEVPEKKSFPEFLRVHAEKRGESACDLLVGTFGRSDLDGQYEDGEVLPSGNTVRPRSGSNTPVRKNSLPKQAMVRPSDKNSRSKMAKNDGAPDG
jgi:IS605 OrfB family transposase